MTTFANFVLASAALLASSGALSAQSATADVPFAFRIPGGSLPAGKYTVHTRASGEYIAQVRSVETRKSVLVMTPSTLPESYTAHEDKSRLVFACRADDCALTQIWIGSEGLSVPSRPARHSAGNERLAMISVNLTHGQ